MDPTMLPFAQIQPPETVLDRYGLVAWAFGTLLLTALALLTYVIVRLHPKERRELRSEFTGALEEITKAYAQDAAEFRADLREERNLFLRSLARLQKGMNGIRADMRNCEVHRQRRGLPTTPPAAVVSATQPPAAATSTAPATPAGFLAAGEKISETAGT